MKPWEAFKGFFTRPVEVEEASSPVLDQELDVYEMLVPRTRMDELTNLITEGNGGDVHSGEMIGWYIERRNLYTEAGDSEAALKDHARALGLLKAARRRVVVGGGDENLLARLEELRQQLNQPRPEQPSIKNQAISVAEAFASPVLEQLQASYKNVSDTLSDQFKSGDRAAVLVQNKPLLVQIQNYGPDGLVEVKSYNLEKQVLRKLAEGRLTPLLPNTGHLLEQEGIVLGTDEASVAIQAKGSASFFYQPQCTNIVESSPMPSFLRDKPPVREACAPTTFRSTTASAPQVPTPPPAVLPQLKTERAGGISPQHPPGVPPEFKTESAGALGPHYQQVNAKIREAIKASGQKNGKTWAAAQDNTVYYFTPSGRKNAAAGNYTIAVWENKVQRIAYRCNTQNPIGNMPLAQKDEKFLPSQRTGAKK